MQKPIYLDYNATTPLSPEVMDTMLQVMREDYGNPSSAHSYGINAKQIIEKARVQVAKLIGCSRDEIVFTSGGTEANNLALRGIANSLKHKGKHIITGSTEHPAIIEVCQALAREGFRITYLAVDEFGRIAPDQVKAAITNDTILISIMHSNNETGTLHPISEIGKLAREHNVVFHTDAAQSAGKVAINVEEFNVDLLTLAGHKFYAPKGIGALFIKRGLQLHGILYGAEQEHKMRPGTENVPSIAALGKAAEIALRDLEKNSLHLAEMRDLLYERIRANLDDKGISSDLYRVNGHSEHRLPNTLNISFRNVDAGTLISEIGDKVALSAGAACHSDRIDISPVLEAMKVSVEYAMGTLRLTTGRETSTTDVNEAVAILTKSLIPLLQKKDTFSVDVQSNKEEIKLTHYTHGLGCACKIQPSVLEEVLKQLPVLADPGVIVGPESADDAAVYRLDDEKALVLTTDFFSPIADDPYTFGAIAASNSLSDIYAMGAKPILALNIVGFPINRLPIEVLTQILAGALNKTNEAGIPILGGHTIDDLEPKFGLVVAGLVHPDKILTNNSAKPGDALILTKSIGTGIITTAIKKGVASTEQQEIALQTMLGLNKIAADIMSGYNVNSCTDITGFGLLGHLSEMTVGSGVDAIIYQDKIPFMPGLDDLIAAGIIPGGTLNNKSHFEKHVEWEKALSEAEKIMLFDAQTSGGLLVSIPRNEADKYVAECRKQGLDNARMIGEIIGKGTGKIKIV